MACDRFRQPTQDTNVDYVKNINFLRRTLFGAPNENFAFETRCKLCLSTVHYFLCAFFSRNGYLFIRYRKCVTRD